MNHSTIGLLVCVVGLSCARLDNPSATSPLTSVSLADLGSALAGDGGSGTSPNSGGSSTGGPTGSRGLLLQSADGSRCLGVLDNRYAVGAQIYFKSCTGEPRTVWQYAGGNLSPDGVHCAAAGPNHTLILATCSGTDKTQLFHFDYRLVAYGLDPYANFLRADVADASGSIPVTSLNCPSQNDCNVFNLKLVGADGKGNGEMMAYRGDPQACLGVLNNTLALQACDAENAGQRWLSWQQAFFQQFGFNQGRLCCNVAQNRLYLAAPSSTESCDTIELHPPFGLFCSGQNGCAVPKPASSGVGFTLEILDCGASYGYNPGLYNGPEFWTYGGGDYIGRASQQLAK